MYSVSGHRCVFICRIDYVVCACALMLSSFICTQILNAQTTVLSIDKGDAMILSGNVYVVHPGDIQNNGLINSDSTSTLVMNGGSHALQHISGSSYDSTRVGNIIQDDSGITLNTYMRVIKKDSFVNGFVQLNNSNWRFEKNAYYAGTDANNKFFQTNGIGYLYKDQVGIKPFLFPVGTLPYSVSYSPFTLKDDSMPDNFGVRVANNQYTSYDAVGSGIGSPDNVGRLPLNWVVKEDVPRASVDSIAMQWYAGVVYDNFIPDSAILDIYNPNTHSFNYEYHVFISGNDPYVLSVPNISGAVFANTPLSFMNPTVALPVELSAFNAIRVNDAGYLAWTTLSEDDVNYFAVERSTDGYTFTTLGHVKAAGHSVSELNYSFTDNNITALDVSTIYYRLRIVNYNGTYNYTQIRVLKLNNNNNPDIIKIYPNPTSGLVHVNITTQENKKMQLMMSDAAGRLVYTYAEDIASGENDVVINISTLPEGSYMLQVQTDAGQTEYRIIKTNQ